MTIRVLAIDDSRTIRGLVKRVMEDAGFNCICAEDGEQGVACFAEEPPDIVITDINMPRLDGYGVIRAIRSGTAQSVRADPGSDDRERRPPQGQGPRRRSDGLDREAL